MPTLAELLVEKSRIEAEIAAQHPKSIAQVEELMSALGVTVADLSPRAPRPVAKRAIKYRDDRGNTWTGIGQRPRWLRAALLAGKTLGDFQIPR